MAKDEGRHDIVVRHLPRRGLRLRRRPDVEVFGAGGGCKEARAEITGQSADVVQITLVTITKQPPGTVCTQEIREVPLTVRLDAPLGNRRLVLEAREETG